MNNGKSDIDRLFDKARAESPVISKDEILTMINSSQPTTPTGNKFIRQIKGASAMQIISGTLAIAAVAGAISFNTIFRGDDGNPPMTKNKNVENAGLVNGNNNNYTQPQNEEIPATTQDINTQARDCSITEEIHELPKINVKGVNIIELKPEELKSLGATIDKKNVIKFTAFNEGPGPILITLSGDSISTSSIKKKSKDIGKMYPKFITDDQGNRRVSLFSSSEDGGSLQALYLAGPVHPEKPCKFKEAKIIVNKKVKTGQSERNERIAEEEEDETTTEDNIEMQYFMNGDISRYVDSVVKEAMKNKPDIDSIVNQAMSQYNDVMKDFNKNFLKKMKIRIKTLDSLDKEHTIIKFGDDSLDTEEMDIQIRLHAPDNDELDIQVDIDSIMNEVDEKLRKTDIELKELDRKMKVDLDKDMKKIKIRVGDIEKEIDNYLRINKLIPVSVRSGEDKLNYILWFDATPELINRMPLRYRDQLNTELKAVKGADEICEASAIAGDNTIFDVWRACNGAIEKLGVFPNPADTKLNVSFSLKESRKLSITLHGLNGNQVKVLANTRNFNAGRISETFSIHDVDPGMYLVTVNSDKGEQAVQRVIIQ